jgi:hypothetical protein
VLTDTVHNGHALAAAFPRVTILTMEQLWSLAIDASGPLLAFLGALLGSWAGVDHARTKAFEEALGTAYARRRIEIIEQAAGLPG